MGYFTYTATESIAPGHTKNVIYTLEVGLQRADPSGQILKREPRALAGNKETLYFGRIRLWSVTIEPQPMYLEPYFREFLDSTADGQVFAFDPYGTPLNPRRQMQVDRNDSGVSPGRLMNTGDPEFSDYFEFSIELNERE